MPQTTLIVRVVKQALKTKGLTYADVAKALDLSEASVKRLFSEENFSLQRLDAICDLLGMEICDLAKMVEEQSEKAKELTQDQEKALVAKPKLLLVFYLLLNDYPLKHIVEKYTIDEHESILLAAELDRMGLIELLPGNRVRLKVSRHLTWRKDGLIRRFFDHRVRSEFLHAPFDRDGEALKFVSGVLSPASIKVMQRKIDLLAQEFAELGRADGNLPWNQRHGCSLMLAQRLWKFSLFEEYERPGAWDETPMSGVRA